MASTTISWSGSPSSSVVAIRVGNPDDWEIDCTGMSMRAEDDGTLDAASGVAQPPGRRRGTHSGKANRGRPKFVLMVSGAIVAAIVLCSLGFGFAAAIETTRTQAAPALAEQYRINLEQFNCLQAEVRHDLPEHASVRLGTAGTNGTEVEQLSEYVTPWAEPTQSKGAAWRITLAPGRCQGVGIVATRSGRAG
jgi:hypothetical protein